MVLPAGTFPRFFCGAELPRPSVLICSHEIDRWLVPFFGRWNSSAGQRIESLAHELAHMFIVGQSLISVHTENSLNDYVEKLLIKKADQYPGDVDRQVLRMDREEVVAIAIGLVAASCFERVSADVVFGFSSSSSFVHRKFTKEELIRLVPRLARRPKIQHAAYKIAEAIASVIPTMRC